MPMPRKPPVTFWKKLLRPETYDFKTSSPALRFAKRLIIGVVGVSVLLVGLVMIVTPGPAIVVIPAGLAILAIEFAWARRWLRRLKAYTRVMAKRAKRRKALKQTAPIPEREI